MGNLGLRSIAEGSAWASEEPSRVGRTPEPIVAEVGTPAYVLAVISSGLERWTLVPALVWVGCAPSPELDQLKVRAAYDMMCSSRDDIHVKALGNDSYDVDGCGKRARYVWVCQGHAPMSPCKWVRNRGETPRPADSAR
jgi:hypothetical protein